MLAPVRQTDGTVEGYASLFGVVDSARDMMMPGAFARTLERRAAHRIPLLFQHDPAEPIGVWLDLKEDARGLRVRGRLIRYAHGSFFSRESANDFVNRTLEDNRDAVDLVASGQKDVATLDKRFGYPTGREVFRSTGDSDPYMRNTYGVRVIIRHDPSAERGYRVRTAFPVNEDSKR